MKTFIFDQFTSIARTSPHAPIDPLASHNTVSLENDCGGMLSSKRSGSKKKSKQTERRESNQPILVTDEPLVSSFRQENLEGIVITSSSNVQEDAENEVARDDNVVVRNRVDGNDIQYKKKWTFKKFAGKHYVKHLGITRGRFKVFLLALMCIQIGSMILRCLVGLESRRTYYSPGSPQKLSSPPRISHRHWIASRKMRRGKCVFFVDMFRPCCELF